MGNLLHRLRFHAGGAFADEFVDRGAAGVSRLWTHRDLGLAQQLRHVAALLGQADGHDVAGAAGALGAAGIGVLHAYGPKNSIDPKSPDGAPPYRAVGYLKRMDLAYAAADLVICRSGAMTVAEVSATGLPAVYVPLPHGNGEQELNALPVVQAGGGLLVPDDEMSPDWVAREVPALLGDPARLAQMAANAAVGGHRDAATRVACAALELAEGHRGGR